MPKRFFLSALCYVSIHSFLHGSSLGFSSFRWRAPHHQEFPQSSRVTSFVSGTTSPEKEVAKAAVAGGGCVLAASVTAAAALLAAVRWRPGTTQSKRASRPRITACRGTVLDKKVDSTSDSDQEAEEGTIASQRPERSPKIVVPDSEAQQVPQTKSTTRPAPEQDGWAMLARFTGALWETFVDVATSQSTKGDKKGWEYRKGIEGMSMGSMAYEMMTTSESSRDYKGLAKEYESGYGMPFLNLTFRKIVENTREVSKSIGLDGPWLTVVNLLQTVGMSGEVVDGIPVQNKWMTIVKDSFQEFGKRDAAEGQRQAGDLMQNMIMGRMERITGAPMPVFLEGYGENEGIYKIVIGPRSVVVVSDPVIVKRIFTSSNELYTKGILSEVLEPIMGKGLIPADPVTWKKRRRAIVPGFHKRWLQDTTQVMNECAASLANDLEKQIAQSTSSSTAEVNMEEKFTSASLDIIGKAIFDYDFGSVERESPLINAVYNLLREAERRAQSVVPYWNLPGASSMFRDQKDHKENLMLINAVLDELIRKALEQDQGEGESSRVSFLQYLVTTKGEDVTTRQLRDDLMTLLIAGHETTAAMLTWTLHELMKPENACYLADILEEVDTVLQGRTPTYEDFAKLPTLRLSLLEALRLYPEPPMLIRRCVDGDEVPVGPLCTDVVGDSVSFLPGQDIFISVWSLQRSKTLWGEDANMFNPHRWKEKVPASGSWQGYDPDKAGQYPDERASDFAFLPFGAGSRKCVGDNFALLEAEAVMVSLLQRFEFEPCDQQVEMTTGATIHTAGGLMTKVRLRTTSVSTGRRVVDTAGIPKMEKKLLGTVEQRISPEAMVVPTARELRMLFTAQKEDVRKLAQAPELYDPLEAAYKQCQEITREHSKTFYLGSQLLEPDEQRVVWAIYNWCRSTDELVDGPAAETTTMADLEDWEKRLNQTFQLNTTLKPGSDWADLAMADSVRRFSLIERPFQDMIGGMAMDLVKDRYATFQELEVYCYRVAGTVGVMTLPVLGFDRLQNFTEEMQEETIAAAMSLGVAFQLTNILRDIGEDARRGRIYVPLEDLDRFGITEEEILKASVTEGMLYKEQKYKDFMEFQMARCELEYEKAKAGIVGLSEVNRLGVMAALYVYGDILTRIRDNAYDNLSRRAYVPFNDKMLLMGKAWLKCQELKEVAEENVRSGKVFKRSRPPSK
eukprot:TRINITY_DN62214_c0_g1_i1.p1 TRINITY_DN62214_c0_g1~~TRINITY_DN62214_c0_g1_i1.p1  ORF type:complete len:1225 (+),score=292.33 TRINITY_DN62214_c0_g1_i1:108-3677(+)